MPDSTIQEPAAGAGAEPEPLIALIDAPKLKWLRRYLNGRSITYQTIFRWARNGLKDGARLRAVRVGGVWATRQSWLEKFFQDSADSRDRLQPLSPGQTHARAERKLKNQGAI
jgi:hypothetical protein